MSQGPQARQRLPEHLKQESENWGQDPTTLLLPRLTLTKMVDFSAQLPLTSTLTTVNVATFKLSGQPQEQEIPSRFFLINLFIYFWLHWVFVAAQVFSGCVLRGLFFVAVGWLLIVEASLVAEHEHEL